MCWCAGVLVWSAGAGDIPAIIPTGDSLVADDLPADYSTTSASFRASVAVCGSAFLRTVHEHLTEDDVANVVRQVCTSHSLSPMGVCTSATCKPPTCLPSVSFYLFCLHSPRPIHPVVAPLLLASRWL